jgi:hypothetical protein
MSDMLEELADYMDSQFSWLTLPSNATSGQEANFFKGKLPDTPDFAVAIYQYGGSKPFRTFGRVLFEKPRLQVMVRSFDYTEASNRSYEILRLLTPIASQYIGGTRYLQVEALGSPGKIGPDPKNRERFTMNYEVWKDWSA